MWFPTLQELKTSKRERIQAGTSPVARMAAQKKERNELRNIYLRIQNA